MQSQQYNELINQYPKMKEIILKNVKALVQAVFKIDSIPYELGEGKIGYRENDGTINKKKSFNYITMYQYFDCYTRNKIDE